MNLENIVQQILDLAGTYNLRLVVLLFFICAIGELYISVPYLLETIWLLSGYHVGSGVLSPLSLLTLWLAAQAGRQTGATGLFYLTRLGSMPIGRFYQKHFGAKLEAQSSAGNSVPLKIWHRLSYLSPFSVAMGRLFWLRIPMTLALGVQRRLVPLSLGVLMSSLVWDGIYISVGIAGGRTVLSRVQMVLFSLTGLTLLYVITFAVRRVLSFRRKS